MDRCEMCGCVLPYQRWIQAGIKKVCEPLGSGCHALWRKTRNWHLTPEEAAELLAEGAA